MSTKDLKRVGVGLLTTVVILVISDFLPSLFPSSIAAYQLFGQFYLWIAVEGAVFMFAATAAGAYVARRNFIGPAIILAISVWGFTIYFLNDIATFARQNDFSEIAMSNVLSLLFSTLAAVLGATVGRRLAKENEDNATNAA